MSMEVTKSIYTELKRIQAKTNPEIHRAVKADAAIEGISMEEWLQKAILERLQQRQSEGKSRLKNGDSLHVLKD